MKNITELTAEEVKINEARSENNWNLYEKRVCALCGKISPFRTEDELAASGWKVYFGLTKCPECWNRTL